MISGVVLRTQPDGKLVALAAGGSEAAFEAIVQRYRRVLLSYCRTLLLSESRSEDVVQQALLNAWAALRAGAEVREVKAWLYRITHNQAIRALRTPGYDFSELNESLCGIGSPDSDLERRMLMRETLAAVAALPELQREAILRTAIDGHSYEEVAVALGITDQAVRGLIYRARASLRTGMAAFAPAPLVIWAAGQARRAAVAQSMGGALAGGGSAGGAAVVLKGAAVLATSAAVVGGTVGGAIALHPSASPSHQRHGARHAPTARRASSSLPAKRSVATRAPVAGHNAEPAATSRPRPVLERASVVAEGSHVHLTAKQRMGQTARPIPPIIRRARTRRARRPVITAPHPRAHRAPALPQRAIRPAVRSHPKPMERGRSRPVRHREWPPTLRPGRCRRRARWPRRALTRRESLGAHSVSAPGSWARRRSSRSERISRSTWPIVGHSAGRPQLGQMPLSPSKVKSSPQEHRTRPPGASVGVGGTGSRRSGTAGSVARWS